MNTRKGWAYFVDGVTVVWLGLFLAHLGAAYLRLSPAIESTVEHLLRVLLVVFLLDLVVLYRRWDDGPRAFVRTHWFLILTVIPWFRPIRVFRAGRGVRALRALVRSRRVGGLVNKLRRMGRRLLRGGDSD